MQTGNPWVSYGKLGEALHVSRPRISVKMKDYPGRRNKKGEVRLKDAIAYYESTTQQARRKRPKKVELMDPESAAPENLEDPPDYQISQARKEAALARLKEMEADQKEGELFQVREGVKLMVSLAKQLTERLRAMEQRVASKLVPLTNVTEIRATLKKEHDKVLEVCKGIRFS